MLPQAPSLRRATSGSRLIPDLPARLGCEGWPRMKSPTSGCGRVIACRRGRGRAGPLGLPGPLTILTVERPTSRGGIHCGQSEHPNRACTSHRDARRAEDGRAAARHAGGRRRRSAGLDTFTGDGDTLLPALGAEIAAVMTKESHPPGPAAKNAVRRWRRPPTAMSTSSRRPSRTTTRRGRAPFVPRRPSSAASARP